MRSNVGAGLTEQDPRANVCWVFPPVQGAFDSGKHRERFVWPVNQAELCLQAPHVKFGTRHYKRASCHVPQKLETMSGQHLRAGLH